MGVELGVKIRGRMRVGVGDKVRVEVGVKARPGTPLLILPTPYW